jgi:hypothetical protein
MSNETDLIPYTHWSYFAHREQAERCRAELADLGFRVAPVRLEAEGAHQPREWLLRAAKEVELTDPDGPRPNPFLDRHNEVQAIVERFGGDYDGGEATYLPDEAGGSTPIWDLPAPEQSA